MLLAVFECTERVTKDKNELVELLIRISAVGSYSLEEEVDPNCIQVYILFRILNNY